MDTYNKEDEKNRMYDIINSIYDKYSNDIKYSKEIDSVGYFTCLNIDCIKEIAHSIDYDRSDKLLFVLHMADCLQREDIDVEMGYCDGSTFTPMCGILNMFTDMLDEMKDFQ